MAKRKICLVEREMWSVREERENKLRFEQCARGFLDVFSAEAEERISSDDDPHGIARCYDTPHTGGLGDAYERDDWREVDPEGCEGCAMFQQEGMPLPLEVDDVLIEGIEMGNVLGHKIGELVAVRPCDPLFEGKTYLGVLAGEMPVQIGLKYDSGAKELMVYQALGNPLIIIPSESAAVYGYESWWHRIESEDDLRDITDEDIMSQPYMAALAKLVQDS